MEDFEDRNERDESKSGFGLRGLKSETLTRFREAVQAAGGNQMVAARSGVPLSTLNKAMRGETQPRAEAMAAIVHATGRSLDWIFFGEAPARDRVTLPDEEVPKTIQQDVLERSIAIVEQWLKDNNRIMAPDKKAHVVAMIYEFAMEDESAGETSIDSRRVGQFLRLVG
ncbi:helix-turn-helix domain-containing protein [Xanthobacter autotrophicus]|uniref:helix-turn-helix domain-containing protein n=1 Tax=Xanthobacter TaxID=279 RepID=UPI0024AB814B|nr:helix-turn-helix transcriptional regulator [Xanthobacter autotrophicus]MDI4666731.1 helix-turn-helix domain-containing protein [Xanthobacter autotrophicus]